ncbi:hypothetical protein HQN64_10675 [Enterobacteriaceae bacterium BIT-l23]|jgi:hypothetical protein|uniref:UPF0509 protein YciZ n=1 Tax=Jejubacter calystegiae TaxID=2579935 RepID=A0A4P8YLC1_9ENTR|nr:hypothetical protein [Jejubacter calystegiae]NUU66573.1 hypothetical protein [Enterobacteriaceae bacterium BIT-l23]QCT21569.1 hypothetical protein FEM41_18875 [Jejubacter calystegiae]
MSTLDPRSVARRIDTVLDILVGGDTVSAIRNLEILREELLTKVRESGEDERPAQKSPWEI